MSPPPPPKRGSLPVADMAFIRAADARKVSRLHRDSTTVALNARVATAVQDAAMLGETECEVSLADLGDDEFRAVTSALHAAGYTVAQQDGDRRRVTIYW